jgi:hypothetical protein
MNHESRDREFIIDRAARAIIHGGWGSATPAEEAAMQDDVWFNALLSRIALLRTQERGAAPHKASCAASSAHSAVKSPAP